MRFVYDRDLGRTYRESLEKDVIEIKETYDKDLIDNIANNKNNNCVELSKQHDVPLCQVNLMRGLFRKRK